MSKFVVIKDSKGEWRFTLVASNGEPVAQSEGYTRKSSVLNGVAAVMDAAAEAVVVFDVPEEQVNMIHRVPGMGIDTVP